MFATLLGLIAALSAHIAIACGYLPSIGSGFALESEQKALVHRIDIIATVSLEREMRAKMAELCKEREWTRRGELNDDISRLQREYKEITGEWYNVPPCDKL